MQVVNQFKNSTPCIQFHVVGNIKIIRRRGSCLGLVFPSPNRHFTITAQLALFDDWLNDKKAVSQTHVKYARSGDGWVEQYQTTPSGEKVSRHKHLSAVLAPDSIVKPGGLTRMATLQIFFPRYLQRR